MAYLKETLERAITELEEILSEENPVVDDAQTIIALMPTWDRDARMKRLNRQIASANRQMQLLLEGPSGD